MITLAAADTLVAGGDVASMLTSTVFGMELASGVQTYKVLDQRQLASSPATIYTAPGSTTTFVKSISVVNNANTPRTVQYFRGGTAASNALTPVLSLVPLGWATYEDGKGWQTYTERGELVRQVLKGNVPENYGISVASTTAIVGDSIAENYNRKQMDETNTVLMTTGQLYTTLIWLTAGMVVSSMSFHSATTALVTGTRQIFGLYDTSRALLWTSADDTSTAWGANTLKTLKSGSTDYTVPTTGLYYAAITIAAATIPTIKGMAAAVASQLRGAAPICHGLTSDSALTALPANAGTITQGTTSAWASVNGMA